MCFFGRRTRSEVVTVLLAGFVTLGQLSTARSAGGRRGTGATRATAVCGRFTGLATAAGGRLGSSTASTARAGRTVGAAAIAAAAATTTAATAATATAACAGTAPGHLGVVVRAWV